MNHSDRNDDRVCVGACKNNLFRAAIFFGCVDQEVALGVSQAGRALLADFLEDLVNAVGQVAIAWHEFVNDGLADDPRLCFPNSPGWNNAVSRAVPAGNRTASR